VLTKTLIIDKRKEISIKYKKLIEDSDNTVIISRSLHTSLKLIQDEEPDLIIISDSIEEPLPDFCSRIRVLTYNMRPVIIALSKSSEINDKLETLKSGADDFISEPVNSEEFKMRIKAHLRREFESNIDLKTKLPNNNYSKKILKRLTKNNEHWAALLISIENFDKYKEMYTELASDKLIQTYCAIINSALSKEDYFGHYEDSKFLIITNPIKVEKLASFLVFAFDSVAEKFYTEEDKKRGYIILDNDEKIGRRCEFVATTIGIISSDIENFTSVEHIISSLKHIHSMAKLPSGSNYMLERQKISTPDAIVEKKYNNKILVIENDESLALLLRTSLELEGYNVIENNNQKPGVIILDSGDNMIGLELCKKIKENNELANSKIIVTSNYHDKTLILNSGADLYLPKPYELSQLLKWVKHFVEELNS